MYLGRMLVLLRFQERHGQCDAADVPRAPLVLGAFVLTAFPAMPFPAVLPPVEWRTAFVPGAIVTSSCRESDSTSRVTEASIGACRGSGVRAACRS